MRFISFYFIFYREFDDLIEEKPSVIDFTEAYTDAEGNVYCTLCPRKWNRSQSHTQRHFKLCHNGKGSLKTMPPEDPDKHYVLVSDQSDDDLEAFGQKFKQISNELTN